MFWLIVDDLGRATQLTEVKAVQASHYIEDGLKIQAENFTSPTAARARERSPRDMVRE